MVNFSALLHLKTNAEMAILSQACRILQFNSLFPSSLWARNIDFFLAMSNRRPVALCAARDKLSRSIVLRQHIN